MKRSLPLGATAFAALLIAGCNTVQVSSKQEIGVPLFAPTDPGSVVIMREPPARPNVRLGEVYAEPTGSPSVTEIEARMQQEAAKMGANAVVIVADQNHYMGTIVSGPWYARSASADYQRVITGVAIRYTSP